MKRSLTIVFCVVIVLLIVLYSLPNEKKRFAHDVMALKKAVEEKDRDQVLRFIDSTYIDAQGLDYQGMVLMIDNLFAEVNKVSIAMRGLTLRIDSVNAAIRTFASCSLGLRITAQIDSGQVLVFGGLIQPSPVSAYFKRTADRYKLYSARY